MYIPLLYIKARWPENQSLNENNSPKTEAVERTNRYEQGLFFMGTPYFVIFIVYRSGHNMRNCVMRIQKL